MELSKSMASEVTLKQWEVSLVGRQMNKAYKTEFQMKKLLELGTSQCQQIEDSYQKISQQTQAKMATWHSFLA